MKTILKTLLIIATFLTTNSLFSQEHGRFDTSLSTVVVKQDPRFVMLSEKQAEINRRATKYAGSGVRRGFRIQVANTQNRDEANAVKAELLRRFPDQKTYLMYQAPNFRVRLGNFLTQRDAATLRKMISALYPNKGIYVVPDAIEYRPQFEEEDL